MVVEELFYKYLCKEIGITEFEQLIYSLPEVESSISGSDYLDLISVNYKSKFAYNEIEKIIEKYIDLSKFEKTKLMSMLERAKTLGKDSGDILIQFYDLYCDGYYFLEDLGLSYGLLCHVPQRLRKLNDTWDALDEGEKMRVVTVFYPSVIYDIERVQEWIKTGKIVLAGRTEDRLQFIDYRTKEEKKSRYIVEPKESKKWWEFWK